jgi:hypothetical protein
VRKAVTKSALLNVLAKIDRDFEVAYPKIQKTPLESCLNMSLS